MTTSAKQFGCILIASASVVHADWTVSLPERQPDDRNPVAKVVGPGGVVVVIRSTLRDEENRTPERMLWYSKSGVLLVDRVQLNPEIVSAPAVFLNERQLLTVVAPNSSVLITSKRPGDYDVNEYRPTTSQSVLMNIGDSGDSTGFYYTDSTSWTLTRVDFPIPPSSDDAAVITIEAADQVAGPWSRVGDVAVDPGKPQSFYRLRIDTK